MLQLNMLVSKCFRAYLRYASSPTASVDVSKKDQAAVKKLLAGGIEQVRVAMRAVALLRLGEGMGAPQIAAVLPLTRQAVRNLAGRYQQGGLERAL
jgi:hypothetical protein